MSPNFYFPSTQRSPTPLPNPVYLLLCYVQPSFRITFTINTLTHIMQDEMRQKRFLFYHRCLSSPLPIPAFHETIRDNDWHILSVCLHFYVCVCVFVCVSHYDPFRFAVISHFCFRRCPVPHFPPVCVCLFVCSFVLFAPARSCQPFPCASTFCFCWNRAISVPISQNTRCFIRLFFLVWFEQGN